jgi:hypothetical protein
LRNKGERTFDIVDLRNGGVDSFGSTPECDGRSGFGEFRLELGDDEIRCEKAIPKAMATPEFQIKRCENESVENGRWWFPYPLASLVVETELEVSETVDRGSPQG